MIKNRHSRPISKDIKFKGQISWSSQVPDVLLFLAGPQFTKSHLREPGSLWTERDKTDGVPSCSNMPWACSRWFRDYPCWRRQWQSCSQHQRNWLWVFLSFPSPRVFPRYWWGSKPVPVLSLQPNLLFISVSSIPIFKSIWWLSNFFLQSTFVMVFPQMCVKLNR